MAGVLNLFRIADPFSNKKIIADPFIKKFLRGSVFLFKKIAIRARVLFTNNPDPNFK
jgi:hypothetical protein